MKVLIVLALVAAASCTPAKEGEREKRNLFGSYPLGYGAGISPVGIASPLISSPVKQDTVQTQHTHSSALKSTYTSSVQNTYPAINSAFQAYQPAVAAYQPAVAAYQPAVAAYQPTVAAYQPNLVNYQPNLVNYQPNLVNYQPNLINQQPAYYSAPAQVVPSYYSSPSVQYVNQPALYNSVYQPAYSGVVNTPVASAPVVSSSAVADSPATSNLEITSDF